MKLKSLLVLFVFVLCFTLVFFTSHGISEEQTTIQLAGLTDKLVEIRDVIKMNLIWEDAGKIETRLTGFFEKLVATNDLKFKKDDGTVTTDANEIAQYMNSIKGKGLTYKTTSISYETLTEQSTAVTDPYKKDASAAIVIEFSFTENAAILKGDMSFTLYHMKRCIWD